MSRIGHASGGDPTYTPGDQTGREVCVREWYGGRWDVCLRPKDRAVAERMAAFCEAVCDNGRVGYSQTTRNTLRDEARKAGWDGSKIDTPCNCDCSSFMSVCAEAAGVDMDGAYTYGNAPWTGNMREKFTGTGAFEAISPVPDVDHLRRGDVLVNEQSHTLMILDDGRFVDQDDSGGEAQPETVAVSVGVLRRGDTGETVRAAQALLILRGFSCGRWGTDGEFGDATLSAVKLFQASRYLTADGIVGAETWIALIGGPAIMPEDNKTDSGLLSEE